METQIKNSMREVGFQLVSVEQVNTSYIIHVPFASDIDRRQAAAMLRVSFPKIDIQVTK